ncbi:MAG TPA: type II toxin-antitoxin system VapB family antitoxin [Mycobacteriales bacterium]|nr:type II toxin-antitoxin system VapB family antitoxin [Mycobacteriales bacterium]
MRTTLSLDDDVVAQLAQQRARGGRSFKELVNEALRAGLASMQSGERRSSGPFTHPTSLGRPRLPDVDDVSDVLAIVEGDRYR